MRYILQLSLLLLPGCVVTGFCFEDGDCLPGQRCNSAGACEDRPAGDGGPSPDGRAPIRCPLPGMVKVADLFCIDAHEAARPDATATDPGTDSSKAVSRKGVLPWQVADNNNEADKACKAAGKRLCDPSEWEAACRGPNKTVYGYGDTYQKKTCNGIDAFDEWKFHLTPTGAFAGCTNGYGVFDMNGNVWEHVRGGSGKTIRGGAFNCSDSRTLHRCDYVPGSWNPTAQGFRCCTDGVPETSDAGSPDTALPDTALPDTGHDTLRAGQ